MKKTIKKIIKILKKIKPRNLIILILLFSFNAYAWFIYSTEVSTGLTAHVKSWKVVFQDGDNEIVNFVNIPVENIYPGMDTFTRTITIYNQSETNAEIEYTIMNVRILNDDYQTVEGYLNEELTAPIGSLTSSDMATQLSNDYPFEISMSIESTELSEDGETNFTITVSWPFDSGDDATDTDWGDDAYDYNQLHPDEPSIELNIRIKASQVADSDTP